MGSGTNKFESYFFNPLPHALCPMPHAFNTKPWVFYIIRHYQTE